MIEEVNMEFIKMIILCLIFFTSALIGRILSKRFAFRLEELEEMQNALNVFKSKIKFTYEPLPEIFEELSNSTISNVSYIFSKAKEKMNEQTADTAWEDTLNEIEKEKRTNLSLEDIHILKNLSKLLGQTDVEGQVGQIEITQSFLNAQIKQAEEEKVKNQKLYSRLGTTIGLAIVIILF